VNSEDGTTRSADDNTAMKNLHMKEAPSKVKIPPEIERMATVAVDAAFAVHSELGPGLLESAYEACFACELELRAMHHRPPIPVPLNDRGRRIEVSWHADVVLEGRLLIESKAVEAVLPVHRAHHHPSENHEAAVGPADQFQRGAHEACIQRILNVPTRERIESVTP
jgi:GxxExxY protein